MKKLVLFMASVLVALTGCAEGKNSKNFKSEEVQCYESFTKIDMQGVGKIIYTQGDVPAVKMEGDADVIARTKVIIKDATIQITQEEQKKNKTKDGLTFYLTSPALTNVNLDGVGSFEAPKSVAFNNDFSLEMNGVGSVKIADMTCVNLEFLQNGVGSSEIKVKCNDADIHSEGVGKCNIDIEAEKLNLINEGVGAMKVSGHVNSYSPHSDGITSKITDKDLKIGK